MKLILCPICDDIVALSTWKKSCKCGAVYGKYLPDKVHAKVSPGAILIACNTNKIVFIGGEWFRKLTFEIPQLPHDGCDFEIGQFDD